MKNTSFFTGFRREYVQMVPKWLEGPRPETSLGYKISVENSEKKCILRPFSDRFLKFGPLPPPHFRDDWIFVTFPYFLSIELGLARIWLVWLSPPVQEGLRLKQKANGYKDQDITSSMIVFSSLLRLHHFSF